MEIFFKEEGTALKTGLLYRLPLNVFMWDQLRDKCNAPRAHEMIKKQLYFDKYHLK